MAALQARNMAYDMGNFREREREREYELNFGKRRQPWRTWRPIVLAFFPLCVALVSGEGGAASLFGLSKGVFARQK